MTDTPIADSAAQDTHDNAVPVDVPDTSPVPDDDGAAVFAAATDPAPATDEAEPVPATLPVDVGQDAATFAATTVPTDASVAASLGIPAPTDDQGGYAVIPVEGPGPTVSDVADVNANEVLTLARDTNARIRNMEALVSGFIEDAKPVLDKFGQGGISGLVGMMFGK